ncbi:MAG: phosphoribosylanthranilate isomerase [Phycisphaerales bacterium]
MMMSMGGDHVGAGGGALGDVGRTMVKICGLRCAEDVEAAVRSGADFVGVVLSESVRRVSVERAAELVGGVGESGVRTVAVYRRPDRGLVGAAVRGLGVDFHQSDHEDFGGALGVVERGRRLPVVRMDGRFEASMEALAGWDGLVLVEGARSGAGEAIDCDRLGALLDGGAFGGRGGRARIVLAGGLDAGNVGEAIAAVRPWCVDVSSGVESSPGMKDAGLIEAFVGAVRAADAALSGGGGRGRNGA